MSEKKEVEMEPPMHIQRPSSARSQDVSHILAGVFRDVFTRDTVGKQLVKHLAVSRSGEEGYHDKYVKQLHQIQEECMKRHKEADILEAHIMQAQAAAMAADERDLQNTLGECEDYQILGLPPGHSNLRNCLDTQLLKKFNLIVPEDFISNGKKPTSPPKADDIPSYARCTTSSQQRYRKTPPLTDYREDVTSSLGFTGTSITYEKRPLESPALPMETSAFGSSKSKTKSLESKSWKDSMKPKQRQIEREDLQRLKSKSEYKRNPRFVPPLTSDPNKQRKLNKTGTLEAENDRLTASAPIFVVNPNPLVFTNYKAGEVYELSIELKNVTSSSRQVRIVPPSTSYFSVGLGRFPSENGIVAPGMSCIYNIRFSPDSLADYDDIIKIKTQVEPALDIPLQGRRTPPLLSLTSILNCGHTLVGGTKAVHFTCTNTGGDGQFCIMRKDSWPASEFKWTLDDPGNVTMLPFTFKPAMFELKNSQTIDLEATFSPISAKFFTQEFVMVCDNCQVKTFTLEGTGQMAGIQFISVSGGVSDYNIGELKDATSQFLIRFDDQNPNTYGNKELTIKNTTNVALPFRWKLLKPSFKSCETSSQQQVSCFERMPDHSGVFSITPNMGTLPPHQIVHFNLEHAPTKAGLFNSVGHLVLEEIPVHSDDNTTSISRDVTAIQVEIKAESKPFSVEVNPCALCIPGKLAVGKTYRYKVKVKNHSVSTAAILWQNVNTEQCLIQVEPKSYSIAPNDEQELTVSLIGFASGAVEKTLFSNLEHSASPIYIHVKAMFEGPEVTIDAMDINFGLVRLGDSASKTLSLTNRSIINIHWTIGESIVTEASCDEHDNTSEFVFTPSHGTLDAGQSVMVSVTFKPRVCRRVRTVFECNVTNGKTSYLSVFSEVQTPLACLLSSSLYIEDVFLDVPVSRTIILQNQTLLASKFKWNEIASAKGSDYTVTFDPPFGELKPRQALTIQVTLTGHKKGPVDNLMVSCCVDDMVDPIWLAISVDIRGLNVTFEMPKTLENQTPEEIMKADLSSLELLDFGEASLGQISTMNLVMTNTTAIRAAFRLHVEHFTAAKPPSPPDVQPDKRSVRRPQSLLARTPNIANPLSKTPSKALTDHVVGTLRNGRGAAFVATPSCGELLPYGYQVVQVAAYNDMWGDYSDNLVCMVEGMDPVIIPIRMNAVGCPLNFQMTKDRSPILRFGTHISGALPVTRSLRVNNTSPFDIRLDWSTYNIEDNDDQLVDMLVSYGQPLPIYDKNEQELPPPVSCDSEPLIQVNLREHDGIRSDKPFQVKPSQQIIPAKGHTNMTVTFTPYTKKTIGHTCTAYAAAYMSLDGPGIDVPDRAERRQGMAMTRFRLDVTANIDPALLSVEMDEDEGCHFTTAASDLLLDNPVKIHRFVFSNTTETPLTLSMEVDSPFKIISTQPPPSAKSSRSGTDGLTTIKPNKNIEVKVGFQLTEQLLSRVNELPANQEIDGCLLEVNETGQKKLSYKKDLVVKFSNRSTQVLPLTGSVAVPTLRLSRYDLDFGTCLVGQEQELQVILTNPSESMSAWITNKDLRYPEVSRAAFSVNPAKGNFEAYVNHVAKNKALIKVTFTARHNVEYECKILFQGKLQEEVQELVVRGRGSYDGRYESLVNVVTEF